MKYLKTCQILFEVLIIICVNIGIVEGIVGGLVAQPADFTYQISLQINNRHICGGAIIGQMHVVTAAHCLIEKNEQFRDAVYTVIGGVSNLRAVGLKKFVGTVEKIFIPKEFKRIDLRFINSHVKHRSMGDIAILKLEKKWPLNSKGHFALSNLNLPTKDFKNVHKKAIISGFGAEAVISNQERAQGIEKFSYNHCIKLKFAETKIQEQRDCDQFYGSITVGQFCAYTVRQPTENVVGVCDGDSGSPLVYARNTLIGILMETNSHCNDDVQPGLYTNVSTFEPFIRAAMKEETSFDMRVAMYRNILNYEKQLIEIFRFI